MKLGINNSKKMGEFTNSWKLNSTLLDNIGSRRKLKNNLKSILRQIKTKPQLTKTYKTLQKGQGNI